MVGKGWYEHAFGISSKYRPKIELCNLRVQSLHRARCAQARVISTHHMDRKLRKCYPRGEAWARMLYL